MLKGFNTDVDHGGISYHIQTEDWGMEKSVLLSRVFQNGAVIKSIRTSYADILPKSPSPPVRMLQVALEEQHKQVIKMLVAGKLL